MQHTSLFCPNCQRQVYAVKNATGCGVFMIALILCVVIPPLGLICLAFLLIGSVLNVFSAFRCTQCGMPLRSSFQILFAVLLLVFGIAWSVIPPRGTQPAVIPHAAEPQPAVVRAPAKPAEQPKEVTEKPVDPKHFEVPDDREKKETERKNAEKLAAEKRMQAEREAEAKAKAEAEAEERKAQAIRDAEEEKAADLLKHARRWRDEEKNEEVAQRRIDELLRRFPNSKAADEARKWKRK